MSLKSGLWQTVLENEGEGFLWKAVSLEIIPIFVVDEIQRLLKRRWFVYGDARNLDTREDGHDYAWMSGLRKCVFVRESAKGQDEDGYSFHKRVNDAVGFLNGIRSEFRTLPTRCRHVDFIAR